MAYSYVHYAGNGGTTLFSIPFEYLEKDNIQVTVADTPVSFTWINDQLIQISPAPAPDLIVEIRRSTKLDDRFVDYTDVSFITEAIADVDSKQSFFLCQELYDQLVAFGEAGPGGGGYNDPPLEATYLLRAPNVNLPNAQALNTVTNGLMKNVGGIVSAAQPLIDYAPWPHEHEAGEGTGVEAHNILSAEHLDTVEDTVVEGDLLIANSSGQWERLPMGVPGEVLAVRTGESSPRWAPQKIINVDVTWHVISGTADPMQYQANSIDEILDFIYDWRIAAGVTLTIQVDIASITYTESLLLNHPETSQIKIVGDPATPANRTLTFTGCDGIVAEDGLRTGQINGFTIKGNDTTETVGVVARRGGFVDLGPNNIVEHFYWNIGAEEGGTVNANGVTSRYAGFWNVVAGFNATIRFEDGVSYGSGYDGIHASSAGMVYCRGAVSYSNLGSNFLAGNHGCIIAPETESYNAGQYGYGAISHGYIWNGSCYCHDNTQKGLYASGMGMIYTLAYPGGTSTVVSNNGEDYDPLENTQGNANALIWDGVSEITYAEGGGADGALLIANNLSDLSNKATAWKNLGLNTGTPGMDDTVGIMTNLDAVLCDNANARGFAGPRYGSKAGGQVNLATVGLGGVDDYTDMIRLHPATDSYGRRVNLLNNVTISNDLNGPAPANLNVVGNVAFGNTEIVTTALWNNSLTFHHDATSLKVKSKNGSGTLTTYDLRNLTYAAINGGVINNCGIGQTGQESWANFTTCKALTGFIGPGLTGEYSAATNYGDLGLAIAYGTVTGQYEEMMRLRRSPRQVNISRPVYIRNITEDSSSLTRSITSGYVLEIVGNVKVTGTINYNGYDI